MNKFVLASILRRSALGAVFAAASLIHAAAENWPTWRGPGATGISSARGLPTSWDTTRNILWRTPLREPGNSTPIIWDGRIFLTQAEGENRRLLLCFDAADGKLLWQSGVEVGHKERTHDTNPYAAASPVTDGERVIAWFGSAGLVCYDLAGKELWRADLGPHDHVFGYGGSPVIHGNLVFLNFGPGAREFLVAVDKRSGAEVWRHESPTPGVDDIHGTWSTPFIYTHQGQTQLISALRGELAGFDPLTGKRLWHTADFGIQAKASPIAGEGVVVLSGDLKSIEIAVKLGGSGDISDTHILWKKEPPKRRVGTGVIHNGYFFGSQTGGFADCLELATGKVIWEERLRGPGPNNAIWTSPVLADGKLYIVNQSGDTFVLSATPEFKLLATNSLGERSNSSPAIYGNRIFIRTHQALWAIHQRDDSL